MDKLNQMTYFKGYITDLRSPTANIHQINSINKEIYKNCKRQSYIYLNLCKNLQTDPSPLIQLYNKIRTKKGI